MQARLRARAASALVLVGLVAGGAARAEDRAGAVAQDEVVGARREMEATLARMHATSKRVRDLLRTARRRGTKAQIACADEALSRSDVALRSARDRAEVALAAYARGDHDEARAARRRVAELSEHQRVAARDGAACAPAPIVVAASGATRVRVTIDPAIPPAR